jgi:deazaflavin-dependent oxidoreductase (nitroreductase family)
MKTQNERNLGVINEFRANAGKVGGIFAGRSLLLLHTKGAKSGEERINPVAYVRSNEQFVIIASKGGAPTNPDWYFNLLSTPIASIEVGTETINVKASVVEEPEATKLYAKMIEMMPTFAEYKAKTNRKIPVILLSRV